MAQQSLVQMSSPAAPRPPTSVTTPSNPSLNDHPVHKTLATAANLANLLPTGTVLAFHTLTPSFTDNGNCHVSNKYLTAFLIAFCAIACFLSSFTDSISCDGRLYYGIATFKGLYIFNNGYGEEKVSFTNLYKYKIVFVDFVHAFLSLFVFLIFAFSETIVQDCFFPKAGPDVKALSTNMPIGAGVLSSLLFTIFPTTRKGIGYADMAPRDGILDQPHRDSPRTVPLVTR